MFLSLFIDLYTIYHNSSFMVFTYDEINKFRRLPLSNQYQQAKQNRKTECMLLDQIVNCRQYLNERIQNEMDSNNGKQKEFKFDDIEFSSNFQSGNLAQVVPKQNQTYHLWIEPDPLSSYKTWFYYSVKGIPQGTTVTFCIVNMSNQLKLFKEGHLPVYRSEEDGIWSRVKIPLQQNGASRGEQGYQLTFKHYFPSKGRYYFAFTYPWTYSENNLFIHEVVDKQKQKYFCDYRKLCLTSHKKELNILTITKITQNNSVEMKEIKEIEDLSVFTFTKKKGIFISARVHPGEVASSHILNGFIKFLFSKVREAQTLLEHFVFYIVPMVNPDGVIDGNFRTDSRGNNLNRFYTNPSPQEQPEIYNIKKFILQMIKEGWIQFCLDLHAHVNKQGAFMYGNSTSSLKQQVAVCLFPKLLEYNCRFFDYEACNFSEKNMSSKDKGDELSKEGASRVAIYKESGLVSCWTLECNYNSSKFVNIVPKPKEQDMYSKAITTGQLLDLNSPTKKDELIFLNIAQFEEIGANIAVTLLDYYRLRKEASYFGSKLKNEVNFHLSLAINILRLIPFKFDNDSRKILNKINTGQDMNQNYCKILQKIGFDSTNKYLSAKNMKERSVSSKKEEKVKSLKSINNKNVIANRSVTEKASTHSNTKPIVKQGKTTVIIIPNVPKVPRKK